MPCWLDGAGAGLLAQADRQHLQQPAFVRSVKIGVDFRAVGDDEPVGLGDILVQIRGHADARHACVHHFHRGMDGAAHRPFADTQPVQHIDLAFGRAAAVAAHGWHNKGLAAGCFDQRHQRAGNAVDFGDAAAAETEGDALAADLRRQAQPRELRFEPALNIDWLALRQRLLDRIQGRDGYIVHEGSRFTWGLTVTDIVAVSRFKAKEE